MADSQNSIGGRYQIITPLGKGGMGIVYKAYDPVLDRTVAIKKMAASIVDHEEFRQRFFIEARAVARLNHPNIVTIHELEEDEGGIYIVMEMLDGVSLSAVMKNGISLSRDTQVTLLSKVASGLDYAHQRGVVHRDIKPANLMLTMSGGVKILDFGIARFATSEMTSMGGSMLGTPHYMSPEQIEGKQVDARADWFSYGAVAYELIARQKPFDAPSVPPLLMKITSTMHVPLIDVAPDTVPPLSAIVDRLLAKNRDDRPSNGADVQCALTASGDTNREDLIASVVKSVLGDAGDVTIIQPMSARGMTGPMIAAKPSTPVVIAGSTSTTPVGLPPGRRGPGMLAPSDPTQSVTPGAGAPGAIVQSPTVALPDTAAVPLPATGFPVGVPAGTSTVGIAPPTLPQFAPPAPVSTSPVTAIPSTTPIGPIGSVSSTTGTDLPPAPPPPPIVSAPPPPAPSAPVAVASSPISTGVPAKKSSLKGALIVVLLLLFVIGASGAAAVYWWATHTASGQFVLNSLLGRKPEVTTASTTTSPTDPGTPSSSTPSSTAPGDTTSPSTPGASTQPTQPVTDSSSPSSATPGTSSLPSSTAPGDSKPATEPTSTTPASVESSSPSTTTPSTSTPSTATPSTPASPGNPTPGTPSTSPGSNTPNTTPRVADATPSRPPVTEPREPRTPTSPRTETPRRSATPAEPLPPERGPAPPPPPAEDGPRVASRDTRAPLDQATVDAFKGPRGSSAPNGYGNIDSPMMQASVVRIKDALESYSQAIEHQDLDALHAVREPISAAESEQVKSAKPTLVHFSEVEVKTDGKTATVVARRNITVGGANKFNGFVEIRLSRRPGGWVITDIR